MFARSPTRVFATMGSRIEERHRRCAQWWEPHIRNTRDFVRAQVPVDLRVGVLGAGRLLDVDATELLESSSEVHLFDADPGCRSAWRSSIGPHLRHKMVPRIEDVTGCIHAWSQCLTSATRARNLEASLLGLAAPRPGWADEPFDVVVSLNMLGQIPLYWRDLVRPKKGDLSEAEEAALALSMGELQAAHLRALIGSRAACIILLFDSEYYFYDSSCSEWRTESALFGDTAALLREQGALRPLAARDTWLWHLAPQFVEQDDEGEIHKVEALAWGQELALPAMFAEGYGEPGALGRNRFR